MIVKINDIEVKTLLDSGSVVILLSEELAKKCDLRIHKLKAKLKSAFDQLVSVKGIVYFRYVFRGIEKVVRAFVAGKTSCPLILGSDFFRDNELVLDHKDSKVGYHSEDGNFVRLDSKVATIHFVDISETEWKRRSQNGSVGGIEGRERPVSSIETNSRPAGNRSDRNGGPSHETESQSNEGQDSGNQNVVDSNTEGIAGDACAVELVEEVDEELVASIGEVYGIQKSNEKPIPKTYSLDKYFDRNDRTSFLKAFPVIPDLSKEDNSKVEDILWEFKEVMSEDDYDVGLTTAFEQPIRTKEDFESRFRRQGKRHFKPEEKRFLEEWTTEMKRRGIIKNSKSGIASWAHVVKANNKNWRVTLDLRELNRFIKAEDFPYVSMTEPFDDLDDCEFYSTFDLTMAFYSILIKESDQWKTSFKTHNELLQMCRLPMGLKSSPGSMQQLTDMVVRGAPHLVNYVDDILVKSKSFAEHLEHIKDLFQRLKKFNLKVKPKKCCLFRRKVQFLGSVISKNGIEIAESRIKAVEVMTRPKNKTEIRSFLGTVNFCCNHIDSMGKWKIPLQDMTKDGVDFEWNDELEDCWLNLKKALKTAPVLVFPRSECLKVLTTDASNKGVGGMLAQIMDGNPKPLGYFSKTLSRSERKWSTIERELYGIKIGIKKYRKFLLDKPFEVYTDHKPLLILNKYKEIQNERLNRWGMELSTYQFVVKYIKGSENIVADTLSRLVRVRDVEGRRGDVLQECESYQLTRALDRYNGEEPEEEDGLTDVNAVDDSAIESDETHAFTHSITPLSATLEENNISAEQKKDNFCKSIRQLLEKRDKKSKTLANRFVVINDTLYRKKRKSAANSHIHQTVIPASLVGVVIKTFHESTEDGGHRGTEKVEKDVALKYWFENYRDHIRAHIRQCRVCNRIKPANHRPYGIPQIIESPYQPFEHLNADIMGPFKRSRRGNAYIITIVCRLTRFIYAKAMPNHTKESVMKAMIEMFGCYATPKRLTTDRGTEFMSGDFQTFLKGLAIEHYPSASYYAAGDGLAEVNNRKILQILKSRANDKSVDWDLFLSSTVKLINKSVNCVTKYTPFYLVFGFNPSNAFERKFKTATISEGTVVDNSIAEEEGVVERARIEARERTKVAEEKWRKMRESNLSVPPFDVKDLVWAIDRTVDPGVPSKLKPLKNGPWIIVKKSGQSSFHIYPMVVMGGRERHLKVVNSQMLFPYIGAQPAGYEDMCKRIDDKEFENQRPERPEDETWSIENQDLWKAMIDESLRQRTSDRITRSQTMSSTQSQTLQPSQQSQSEIIPENYSYAQHIQWLDQQIPVSDFDREEVQNTTEYCTQNSQQSGGEDRLRAIYEELRQVFSDSESGSSFPQNDSTPEAQSTQQSSHNSSYLSVNTQSEIRGANVLCNINEGQENNAQTSQQTQSQRPVRSKRLPVRLSDYKLS